jgi:hypothetical protein
MYNLFHPTDVAVKPLKNLSEIEQMMHVSENEIPKNSVKAEVVLVGNQVSGLQPEDIVYIDHISSCFIDDLNLIIVDEKNILLVEDKG